MEPEDQTYDKSVQAEGVRDREGGDVPVQAPEGAAREQGARRQDHQPLGQAHLQPLHRLQGEQCIGFYPGIAQLFDHGEYLTSESWSTVANSMVTTMRR